VKFWKHLTEDFSETDVAARVKWEYIKIDIKSVEGTIHSLNLCRTGISKTRWQKNFRHLVRSI